MQSLRSNITRLKNQIESSFPENSDLFEFPGITRAGLVSLMESASAETYELLENEADFEVVLLKRKIADPLESCREYLSDYKGGEKDEKHFNEFVRSLTDIRDQIRLAYLICNKSGIRSEDTIQETREALEELLNRKSQLESEVSSLLEVHDELKEKLKSVEASDNSAQEHLTTVQQADAEVESLQAKAAAAFEVVTKYEKQITDARESANENSAEIVTLVKRGEKATSQLAQSKSMLDGIATTTKEYQERCKELSQEISNTLAAANPVGMAGSFDSRKSCA